jgi:hypothetical protein
MWRGCGVRLSSGRCGDGRVCLESGGVTQAGRTQVGRHVSTQSAGRADASGLRACLANRCFMSCVPSACFAKGGSYLATSRQRSNFRKRLGQGEADGSHRRRCRHSRAQSTVPQRRPAWNQGSLDHQRMTAVQALAFVRRHGVVIASGKGSVPSLAEAVAGEPIRGSGWGHPKGGEIFRVLKSIGQSPDVLARRLVDGKITYVHRRL